MESGGPVRYRLDELGGGLPLCLSAAAAGFSARAKGRYLVLRDELQRALDGRLHALLKTVQAKSSFADIQADAMRLLREHQFAPNAFPVDFDGEHLLNDGWERAWRMGEFGPSTFGSWPHDGTTLAMHKVFVALARIAKDTDSPLLQDRNLPELEFALCDFLSRRGFNVAPIAGKGAQFDGPETPNLFWWKGKASSIPKIPWRLLDFLWNEEGRKAMQDDVMEAVWGHDADRSEGALTSAIRRGNDALCEAGIPVEMNERAGFIVLTVHCD